MSTPEEPSQSNVVLDDYRNELNKFLSGVQQAQQIAQEMKKFVEQQLQNENTLTEKESQQALIENIFINYLRPLKDKNKDNKPPINIFSETVPTLTPSMSTQDQLRSYLLQNNTIPGRNRAYNAGQTIFGDVGILQQAGVSNEDRNQFKQFLGAVRESIMPLRKSMDELANYLKPLNTFQKLGAFLTSIWYEPDKNKSWRQTWNEIFTPPPVPTREGILKLTSAVTENIQRFQPFGTQKLKKHGLTSAVAETIPPFKYGAPVEVHIAKIVNENESPTIDTKHIREQQTTTLQNESQTPKMEPPPPPPHPGTRPDPAPMDPPPKNIPKGKIPLTFLDKLTSFHEHEIEKQAQSLQNPKKLEPKKPVDQDKVEIPTPPPPGNKLK